MVLKESAKDPPQQQIWVEKYRPRDISDVAHQKEVVATLQKAVTESAGRGDLPHLLFYGPPGTGKTSTALALCRGLFGPHNYRARVLELNASDERGIKVVRDKIKTFAQTVVSANASTKASGDADKGRSYPCPPFKVIVLDEADAITNDAQTALRRTMEAHSAVTRFILICNYVSKIIDPLTSRCAKFRFTPLPLHSVTGHLRRIADAERVQVTDATLRALITAADGDLRKAINTLQSAHRMHDGEGDLSIDLIATAACLVPPASVDAFDDATSAKTMTNKQVRASVDALLEEGYSAVQLLSQYADRLFDAERASGVALMNDLQKAAVGIVLADAEKALNDGCDEQIQLYNVASRISAIAAKPDNLSAILAA